MIDSWIKDKRTIVSDTSRVHAASKEVICIA